MSDDAEKYLLEQLHELHHRFRREADEIIARLAKIDAMKPPRRIVYDPRTGR